MPGRPWITKLVRARAQGQSLPSSSSEFPGDKDYPSLGTAEATERIGAPGDPGAAKQPSQGTLLASGEGGAHSMQLGYAPHWAESLGSIHEAGTGQIRSTARMGSGAGLLVAERGINIIQRADSILREQG